MQSIEALATDTVLCLGKNWASHILSNMGQVWYRWLWTNSHLLNIIFNMMLYYHAGDPGSWTWHPQPKTIYFVSRVCFEAVRWLLDGLKESFLSLLIILPLSITVHGHGIQTQSGRTAQQHTHTHSRGLTRQWNSTCVYQPNKTFKHDTLWPVFIFVFGFSSGISVHCSQPKAALSALFRTCELPTKPLRRSAQLKSTFSFVTVKLEKKLEFQKNCRCELV